ncbi:hypothetical protein GW17_00034597 [Ensete ventricosum]|nr:hypothetical protein GW17_00034597 [Ensete ventricosum]
MRTARYLAVLLGSDCFCPATTRNRLVTVDFDRCWSLSGGNGQFRLLAVDFGRYQPRKGERRRGRRRGRRNTWTAGGLQVQTRSQTVGAAHEERNSEQDEREVRYSLRVEAPSGALIGKKSHKERLTTTETRLDVLEASLEELYQGQRRLLGVESS